MGLLNETHTDYYKSNEYGNNQFISYQDVRVQFDIGYVGEDKIRASIKIADIAFCAHRDQETR